MCFCFTKVRLFEQSWLLHFLVSKFINSMENIICIHCLHFYSRINTKPWNMFVITQIFEKNIKLVKYLILNCAYVLLFFNNFHREEWFLTYQREYLLKLHIFLDCYKIIFYYIIIVKVMLSRFIVRYSSPQYSYFISCFLKINTCFPLKSLLNCLIH